MYDPLALDRQRIEQEQLRRRARAAAPAVHRSSAGRGKRRVRAAFVAMTPHPRPAIDGC